MSSLNDKKETGASMGNIAIGGSVPRGHWYLRGEADDGLGIAKGTVGKLS